MDFFFFFFYTINHFTGQRTGYSILSLPPFLINPIFGTNNNLLGFPDIIVSCVVEPFSIFRSLLITGEKYRVIVLKKSNWVLGSDYGAEAEPHSSLGEAINAQISAKCFFKMHFLGVGTLVLALRD